MTHIAWLAGLLEGEGCFSEQRSQAARPTPLVQLVMTDEDTVGQAAQTIGHILGKPAHRVRAYPLSSGKRKYVLSLAGLDAAKTMMTILPWMGIRRKQKIATVLRLWEPRVYKNAVAYRREIASRLLEVG